MNNMSFIGIVFCYIIVAFGACNVIVFGEGPFHIFTKIRNWAYSIDEHFAKVFTCMMCLPANFGWICSLVNWFLISTPFTPFNIIFNGNDNLWFMAALCDGAFTSGIVYLIYILNDFFEKKIEFYEIKNNKQAVNQDYENENTLIVEDITLKKDTYE